MGMFDRIHNSYSFTSPVLNNTLQTKDISGFMDDFWLSPTGQLFHIDYTNTYDFDADWNPIKNSNNGHVRPHLLTKQIRVVPELDGGCYYQGRLSFEEGLLVDAALWESGGFVWSLNWARHAAKPLPFLKNSR